MNLHDAIGAVREESLEQSGASGATRARVLEAVSTTPRRRLHAAIAAVIASLFGASAFAYYARTPGPPVPKAPEIAVEMTASEVANPADTPAPRVLTTVRIEAPPAPSEPSTSLGTVAEVAPPPPPPPPPPAPIERDAELALYSEAHRAHFVDRDLVRAVAAWDRYLAAMPDGRLAPEARFNRLVALVKLERWADAAKAVDTVDSRPADVEKLRALIEAHAH